MGSSCSIVGRVRNKDGRYVTSNLARDLYDMTGDYRMANRIHRRTLAESFRKNNTLTYDENNDVTTDSLFANTDVNKLIPVETYGQWLTKKQVNSMFMENFNEGKPTTMEDMLNLATKLNKEHIAARVLNFKYDEDRGLYATEINENTANEEANIESYRRLNEQLREILQSFGIEVGVLDELEERLGIHGKVDFSALKDMSSGIVRLIKIAKGAKGEEALPEEFAHFAIDALGLDHPLVARLLNSLRSEERLREVLGDEYDRYDELYNGDMDRMAREAAGHLVADSLLRNVDIPKYRSIIQRIVDAIKQFFSRINETLITKAAIDSDALADEISKGILSRRLLDNMNVENIKSRDVLFSASVMSSVEARQKLIDKLIKTEQQKALIEERTLGTDSKMNGYSRNRLNNLMASKMTGTELKVVNDFILSYYKFISKSFNFLNDYDSEKNSVSDLAKILRYARVRINACEAVMNDINQVLIDIKNNDDASDEDKRMCKEIEESLAMLVVGINKTKALYSKNAKYIYQQFISEYADKFQDLGLSLGSRAGQSVNFDLEKEIYDDESFFDRYLRAAADADSPFTRIFDQKIKQQKEIARRKTIDIEKELLAIGAEAESLGIKDFKWAFEMDENGDRTGYYMSKVNRGKFERDRKAKLEELNKRYDTNKLQDAIDFRIEYNEWMAERCSAVDKTIDNVLKHELTGADHNDALMHEIEWEVDLDKAPEYKNHEYYKLNDKQRRILDKFLDVKDRLEKKLPFSQRDKYRNVMILKDTLERVKSAKNLTDAGEIIKQEMKDHLMNRTDDTEFGGSKINDFNGEVINGLPIFYTSLSPDSSPNDVSDDIVSTLISYAAMANNFEAMQDAIDILEVSREYVVENLKTKGSSAKTTVRKVFGFDVENTEYRKGDRSRTVQHINDLFKMQVYGQLKEDEGTTKLLGLELNNAKVFDTIGELTAISTYALNFLAGISNVMTGVGMMNIEAMASDFFSAGDIAKADRSYAVMLPSFIKDFGKNIKTNKLFLIDELFNVMQDYEKHAKDIHWQQKGFLNKLLNSSPLFLFNNCGEHWMQNRTALAVLYSTKVKNKRTGHVTNLYDAISIKPIDPAHPDRGAKLDFGEWTLMNGKEIDDKVIMGLSNKIKHINQRMHGIYNEADRMAWQRRGIGRLCIMFRKWMVPSWDRRFRHGIYNADIDGVEEGYYRSTAHFMKKLYDELKEGRLSILATYDNLKEHEKRNVRRCIAEVLQFAMVSLGLALIDFDDDDDSYGSKLLEYQLRRLHLELGAQVPFQMPNEVLKIMKSPAAGVNVVQNEWNAISTLMPWGVSKWFKTVETGRYKDWPVALKDIWKALPLPVSPMERALDPDIGIPFLKQGAIW